VKPAPFDYVRVDTPDAAIGALSASEESRLLAGGQSLVPLMNFRLANPKVLIDINPIAELDHVTLDDAAREVRIGALCRHRRLERDPEVRTTAPLIAQAAACIGHPQIRNRGTVGGSLAHGDPSAELGAALVALGGRVEVAGPNGRRAIAAGDLFEGFLSTSIAPNELLVEVVVPTIPEQGGAAFVEYAPRHGDFAIVGVAVQLRREDGRCIDARAAACGAADTIVDLTGALEPLLGGDVQGDEVLRAVAARAAELVRPRTDVHATADDRRELTQILTVQAVRGAWAAARGGNTT
jgi:carbon-monoxide dehydrogenase medium subunit